MNRSAEAQESVQFSAPARATVGYNALSTGGEGCTDAAACNYDPMAFPDDGSCIFLEDTDWCNCDGALDVDDDGICDDADPCIGPDLTPEVLPSVPSTYIAEVALNGQPALGMTLVALVEGITVGSAETFEFEGDSWVSMTVFAEAGDEVAFQLFEPLTCSTFDIDSTVSVITSGGELSTFDDPGNLPFEGILPVAGCTDPNGCNYNPDATQDDGGCIYPDEGGCEACGPNGTIVTNDADGDGVCDEAELAGCTDEEACNFWEEATEDDGTCAYLYIGDISGPNDVVFGDTVTYSIDNLDAPSGLDWIVEGGNAISGLNTGVITVVWDEGTAPATGSVTLIEYNDFCTGDPLQLDVTISPVVGLDEVSLAGWSLFPNPASDQVRLTGVTGLGVVDLRLLQLDGRTVRTWTGARVDVVLDLSGLAAGWYVLEGRSGAAVSAQPLLKR